MPPVIVYVDAMAGDDANTGTAPDQAWASLARVGQIGLAPGSQVLLKRGSVWNEPFQLQSRASADDLIVLGAYGSGPRPRINGGPTHAITADQPISGWRISGLELTSTNDLNPTHKITGGTCGIFLSQEQPCERLVIEDCVIHDTSGPGIYLLAEGKPKPVFQNVLIEHCQVYNASCGIQFLAPPEYGTESFTNFRIAHCLVHDIDGDGIVPFCGRDGVIEHCTAYRTGLGCDPQDHSPVAIWYAWAKNCIIQFCEAYDNHTGGRGADGGGFDFDGGCVDCTLQYNYSHDNDGAGYLICSFDPEKWPCTGNVCRYNVSVNDGLANDYASIHFWQAVDNRIYNNTCITRSSSPLKFMTSSEGNLIANNIFYIDSPEDIPILKADFHIGQNRFRNNLYHRLRENLHFRIQDQHLQTLDEFVSFVNGEGEIAGDPLLADVAAGNFHLRPGSPCRGAGLRLKSMGPRDYYGTPPSTDGSPDIGCAAVGRSPTPG
ncbi:MAG: right-handed parallel beta-helix repeat-containing protein [Armatimonadota bacterium]|nr:MAG: right-handed parallel beta-helix repeat-containing protein [Armatimonadota bacterium]